MTLGGFSMAKHRAVHAANRWLPGVAMAAVVAVVGMLVLRPGDDPRPPQNKETAAPDASAPATAEPCAELRAVAATSFRPMLDSVTPKLLEGPDCVRLATTYSDGRAAAAAVAKAQAQVWIPDDSSWSSAAGGVKLAKDTAGAGTVVATSPLYMVSDAATGARLRAAGGSWMALAKLVDTRTVRLVVRDP